MHHIYSAKNFWLVVAAAPLLAALQAAPAWSVPIISDNLVSPSSPVAVTEGNSVALLFSVTNNTPNAYLYGGNGFIAPTLITGDPTDGPPTDGGINGSPVGYIGCSGGLAANATCYYSVILDTPSDTEETDGDSGEWNVSTQIDWRLAGVGDSVIDSSTEVTIQDPVASGPTGVPEPMSLAMFGAGLLGLAGIRRRRRAK